MTYLGNSSCIVGSALYYCKGLNPAANWQQEKMTVKKQKQSMTYLARSSCIVGSALNYFKGLNPAADWRQEKMTENKTKTKHDVLGPDQLHSW